MPGNSNRLGAVFTAGRLASRRLLRRREGERDAELGELLTSQLDEMKGLAMKLGQIVSYMDVPLPQVAQEKLARLQSGTSGMSEAQTLTVLRDSLGADFLARFDEFTLRPFAAASIGQVHRGRFRGQDVVLKVQYPESARGFANDLAGVNKIAAIASLLSAVDGKAIVRELAERLAEECDYEREARFQKSFAHAFARDASVHVPTVIDELTTKRTIGSTWSDGADFANACQLPQSTRDQYARTLVRFSYRSLLTFAAIQADPHPGNFLFGPEERVTFLDFGCVRTFGSRFIDLLRNLIAAIDEGDRSKFRALTIQLGMAPRPEKFDFEHHFRMMEHLHRPLLAPRFRFTQKFIKEGLDYNGPSSPNARHMSMPPAYIWVARLQWGLWSVLKRLEANAPLRDIFDEIQAEPCVSLV